MLPVACACLNSAASPRRTILSSWADGANDGWLRAKPQRFLVTWTGVRISPQGKPHQPSTAEPSVALSIAFLPHETHDTCGELFHVVITSADQTEWEVWTSIEPTRWHFGHGPW